MTDATSTHTRGLKALPHDIDITAPGGIEHLLDFHRQNFGDAQMNANAGDGTSDDGQAGADGANDGQDGQTSTAGDNDSETEREFPAETPVAEMTAEQQAAYWKFHSRKAERRQKAEREAIEKERATTRAELDQLRQAGLTEAEKAIDTARNEGRTAALAEIGASTVNAFIQGRVAAGLLTEDRASVLAKGMNHSAFIAENGDIDLDGLKDYLDVIAPATAVTPDPHQGNRGNTSRAKSGLSAGADLYTSKNS